jgi:chorismate mutase
MLQRLAEIGMEMAEAVGRQAKACEEATPEALHKITQTFQRTARTVRLTLLLRAKLIQDVVSPKTASPKTASPQTAPPMAAARAKVEARKAQVLEVVGDVARAEHDNPETVERLVAEAAERLDREVFQAELKTRPVSTLVERICEALDLHPDWRALSKQDWAEAEFQSGKASATLAEHMTEFVDIYWPDPKTGKREGELIGRLEVPRKPSG